ncbi:MAG: hypothetical protein ACO395_07320 [Pontimonas sp.]
MKQRLGTGTYETSSVGVAVGYDGTVRASLQVGTYEADHAVVAVRPNGTVLVTFYSMVDGKRVTHGTSHIDLAEGHTQAKRKARELDSTLAWVRRFVSG